MKPNVKIYIVFAFILTVSISAFGQTSPKPDLVFTGKEDIQGAFGEKTIYWLSVSNRFDYPDEIFEPAPDLPACGKNKNSSRSWVDIFAEKGSRIYGFCALKASEELNKMSFQMPKGKTPKAVYIVITDRKTGKKYKSNSVSLD